MAQRTVIEVGPRGGQRVGRYMGNDGKLHWVYLGKEGAGGGSGLEHGHPAPDGPPAEEHRAQPGMETHGHVHKDPRIPPVGTQRTASYKGQQHTVTVTPEGFRYEGNGRQYRSLSQLANELADSRQNGLRFFGLHEDAGVDRRRKEAGEAGAVGAEGAAAGPRTVALSPEGQQAAQAAAQREAAGPQPRTVALAPGASSTRGAAAAPQAGAAGGPEPAPAAESRPPEGAQPPTGQTEGVDEGKAVRKPPEAEPGAFNYMGPGGPNDAAQFEADERKDGKVRLKHPNGLKSGWMPEESVQHFKNDLHGIVDVPHAGADVPHADLINAVAEGRARFLGKGDDGMAFRVGDQVVKVSTTVPYQPANDGHRSPQEAADMLKGQVETANKLADAGVPYVQRSEFVQHGDKGFQIKPYVEIPKKLTREQLDKVQDAMHAMHAKGYTLEDEFQVGLDQKGDPVLFDTGKARPRQENDDAKGHWSDKARDTDDLRRFYQKHGEDFVNTKDPEWKQLAAEHLGLKLVEKMNRGSHDFAARQVDDIDAMRRHDARATLKGDDLRDALEDIETDRMAQHNKIKAHRAKWEAEQAATYGGQNRPLGFGTVPNGHTGFGEHPDFRHGTVTYDKPLDPEEARSYQLDRVVDQKQHGWIARQVAEKLAPDAAEYLEYGKDDPEAFEQGLRQHVADYLHENGLHADVAGIAKTVAKRLEEHAKRQAPIADQPAEAPGAAPAAAGAGPAVNAPAPSVNTEAGSVNAPPAEVPPTATATGAPQTPEKPPEAPPAAPETATATAPPAAAPAASPEDPELARVRRDRERWEEYNREVPPPPEGRPTRERYATRADAERAKLEHEDHATRLLHRMNGASYKPEKDRLQRQRAEHRMYAEQIGHLLSEDDRQRTAGRGTMEGAPEAGDDWFQPGQAPPAAAPQGGLPQRPNAGPQQGALFPGERGTLNLTAPEAPAQRRAATGQASLFGGGPERPAAEPEAPARTNPDEVTTDEQAQRQAAAEESARRRRKPGETEGEKAPAAEEAPAAPPAPGGIPNRDEFPTRQSAEEAASRHQGHAFDLAKQARETDDPRERSRLEDQARAHRQRAMRIGHLLAEDDRQRSAGHASMEDVPELGEEWFKPAPEQSTPPSQEPTPKPASEAATPAPQATETQSQTSQAPMTYAEHDAHNRLTFASRMADALDRQAQEATETAARLSGTDRQRFSENATYLRQKSAELRASKDPDEAFRAALDAGPRHLARHFKRDPFQALRQMDDYLGPQAPTVQEPPPAETPKPAAAAPQTAAPTVQGPRSEAALPPRALEHPPEARGANQPRTTGNEEQRQGNLAAPDIAGMEAALKPHRALVDAAKSPGERLKALEAEFRARSEHGRQLAGMEGSEARQALERNREAMGRLNSAIGSLRAAGAGQKPAPAAPPAESQAEMAESRGKLTAPGPESKPRAVVTLPGALRALEGAKKRTDLTASSFKAAAEALGKGDFTAAREALAKGSTDRFRKTALAYVDRLEDAATGKSAVERAADRELAGETPPSDRTMPVGEAAALAGLAPAKKPEAAPESPKTAPLSPQEAAAAAKPGEYHQAIADHAAAHLTAADERARPHVERILERVGGPAALGENLPTNPEKRKTALGKWAAHVYEKMGPDLEAAGLEPHQAHGLIRHTLERSNWHPEAKAALLAHIAGERGKTLAPAAATIGDAADNLAGGDETRAGHVQQAVDLYDSDWKTLAQKGEVAAARVADLVQKAGQATTPEARQQVQRALAEALGPVLNLARLQDAFPAFQDRAVQPARDALAAASTLGRTKPTRDGAETPLFLQGENGRAQRMKARYRLVEAGDVTTSHDPFSFAQNKAYPEGVQEREYHSDQSDRDKVIKQAQGLTPEFMINTNPDAVNGPPMVMPNGVVLGGNSRAMSLNRAYENHPEVADAYRKHLAETASHFGFTAADVGALKRPMLIRTVEPADQSPEALARLGHQMNAGFTQAMNPAAEQVSLGKQLRPQTLDVLSNAMKPDESLPDFLDSADSREFVEALKKDGVFTERNENQYFDRNKKLNEDGKARVARVLMGRIVGQPDAIRNTPPSLVDSVARVVPTLMQADAAGERYSLGKALRTALEGHAALRSWGKQDASPEGKKGTGGVLSGKSDEAHWQRAWDHLERGLLTRDVGAHPAATDPAARELVQVLVKRGGPRQIVPVFEEYARLAKEKGSAGQNDFFGGSPEGAGDLLRRAVQNVEAREGEVKTEKAAAKAEKEQKVREKVIEEHERQKAEAAAAPPAEAAPAAPEPAPDPQQAAEEARAAREEAARQAEEEQAKRDREEANRNQTSMF